MMRVFVMGDIHGAYRALRQCLQAADFDYQTDHLICLGDVTDGWPETKAAIDELLKIRNLTYILGNHDWWTLQWMQSGEIESIWYSQGGKATVDSYDGFVPPAHMSFLANASFYYLHENRLFVHAGISLQTPLEKQDWNTFLWDRKLASLAMAGYPHATEGKLSTYDEIYIGHTPIPFLHPVRSSEVWLMDTGAGWSGVLSMMDVNSKKMFISDPVPDLYPGVQGRTRNR